MIVGRNKLNFFRFQKNLRIKTHQPIFKAEIFAQTIMWFRQASPGFARFRQHLQVEMFHFEIEPLYLSSGRLIHT